MSATRFFLDTNILIYTFDHTAPQKQAQARLLLERALAGKGAISFQVVQEFLNLALRKLTPPMTDEQARRYLDTILIPLCSYYPDADFYRRALSIRKRWRFGMYDSLIIAAALETGCDILYSEDLQHQQQIETLTIVDPF